MLGSMLVSCKNDDIIAEIDEELERLEGKVPTKVVEEMELDFYIIVLNKCQQLFFDFF